MDIYRNWMVFLAGLVVEWCGRLLLGKGYHASSSSHIENWFMWGMSTSTNYPSEFPKFQIFFFFFYVKYKL